eukprot:1680506-Amphidinium_carterae.3
MLDITQQHASSSRFPLQTPTRIASCVLFPSTDHDPRQTCSARMSATTHEETHEHQHNVNR